MALSSFSTLTCFDNFLNVSNCDEDGADSGRVVDLMANACFLAELPWPHSLKLTEQKQAAQCLVLSVGNMLAAAQYTAQP